jgi:hypothetical protein
MTRTSGVIIVIVIEQESACYATRFLQKHVDHAQKRKGVNQAPLSQSIKGRTTTAIRKLWKQNKRVYLICCHE